MIKYLKNDCRRILAILLMIIMVFTSLPVTAFASGTETDVKDNVVDLTDNKFASLSKYHATATGVEILGADVVSASQDGKDIYITLASATSADAEVTAKFQTTVNRFTVTQSAETVTLENGEAELSVKLTGKYNGRVEYGTYTYTLHYICDVILTEVPECIKDTDTAEVYAGNALELDLRDYFSNATEYYLIKDNEKIKLDRKTYSFVCNTAGTYKLTFAAANNIGEASAYATVTVTVKEITSGIYINKTSSNGSLNFITFTDSSGDYIEGVLCELDGNTIRVTLPGSYNITGKVKADFNLTQNGDGVPFVTTKTGTSGTSSGKAWDQRTTAITATLSGGTAKTVFYYYNVKPTTTNNKYDTFTIEYNVKNELPALADQTATEETSVISAGEFYELDLDKLFSDADGDPLTYYVSINGEGKTAADADYRYSTNTAGEYRLVFTAHDGKGESQDTYTVNLTVDNVKTKDTMTVKMPEDLAPKFYITNGFTDASDTPGESLEAVKTETAGGYDIYSVSYPQNAEYISIRTENWGGMAVAAEKNGVIEFVKVQSSAEDMANEEIDASFTVSGSNGNAVKGDSGYLLQAGQEYTFTAAPTDTETYSVGTRKEHIEASADICTVTVEVPLNDPAAITAPTGAEAQLYVYNKYYSNTEYKSFAVKDNGDGTSTTYFTNAKIPNGGGTFIYRVKYEDHIVKAGWTSKRNITVKFDEDDPKSDVRVNYSESDSTNKNVAEDNVLLNINGQNNLVLSSGQTKTLKAYRSWEIIPVSYNNWIITPDFHYDIISGSDVVKLTDKKSPSTTDTDWKTITALKEGTAVIEVSYDAINVTGAQTWNGIYGAADPARTGLMVVQVGGHADVDFGIRCFASQGNLEYSKGSAKAWDAEFDTLYFTGSSGELELSPTVKNGTVQKVEVSADKGSSWTAVTEEDGVYKAPVAHGNNIIRVTAGNGEAYQIVRGYKVETKFIITDDDGNGVVDAGETVRVVFDNIHQPIPKMAGNYNPGYRGNTDGDSGTHIRYTFDGETVEGVKTQYEVPAAANCIEVTIPEDTEETSFELSDGYIATGVIGLKSFADGGDSHRNIPDAGCATRGSETTFHTRSMLPDIRIQIGEASAPNTAPYVKGDAVTEAEIQMGQKYALNPETLFGDDEGDELAFTYSVNGQDMGAADKTFKFAPDGPGEYKLLFTAYDGEFTAQHTVTLTVTETDQNDDELIFDIKESEIKGYVTVSFEDNGVRENVSGLKYPVPLGTIIEPTRVPFKEGDSIATVTIRLLDAMDIGYDYSGSVDSGFYLGAIMDFVVDGTPYETFGQYDAGESSGWMISLNDWFIDMGASEFTVKADDKVQWKYTCQLGADIGDNSWERAVGEVEELIDAVDTPVTLESIDKIKAAREAYDALSEFHKSKVSNYEKLTAAEKELENLINESVTEEDKDAAAAVDKLIDEIGTVTADSREQIEAARDAYENLTLLQQQLVTKLLQLETAENQLSQLNSSLHEEIYNKTGDYILKLGTPDVGSVGGEWMVIGLARGNKGADKIADEYFNNVVKYMEQVFREDAELKQDVRLHGSKSTDNSRVILALTAAGFDAADVNGYDLFDGLDDMEYIKYQGINGPIWALIALNAHPDYKDALTDVTEENLINEIISAQLSDGGWDLRKEAADTDMTAMALQALAPYYETDDKVKKAVDKALEKLSSMQHSDGGFASVDGRNSESIAQVIVALTALGIDPEKDERFIKTGNSAVDALCEFAVDGGGFSHTKNGKLDGMATEQGYYALAAYFRLLDGKTALYDMSDVTISEGTADLNNDEKEDDGRQDEIKEDAEEKTEAETKALTKSAKIKLGKTKEAKAVISRINAVVNSLPEDPDAYTEDQIQNVVDVYKAYDKLTAAEKLAVRKDACYKAFSEVLNNIGKIYHYDKATETDARDNSDDVLPWFIKLNVGDERFTEAQKKEVKAILGENSEVLVVKDIWFTNILDDSEWHPEKPIKIGMSLKNFGDHRNAVIVHITDEGKIEIIRGTVDGDMIEFEAASFSLYGIAAADSSINELLDTAETPLIWPWTAAGVIALLAVIYLLCRNRKKER